MPAEERVRVVLDLSPGEPITGRIQAEGREAVEFRGWIELASKLEAARTDGADEATRLDGRRG
jgi:hypothetical protein